MSEAAVEAEVPVEETEAVEDSETEGTEGETPTIAELMTEIAKLKQEAASSRIKAREARKELKQVASTDKGAEGDLAAAEARGRESARLEYGVKLAQARVEAALTGVVPDEQIAGVVADLNLSLYVTDDGEVDDDAVKVLKKRYTALLGKKPPAKVSHGRQSSSSSGSSEEREVVHSLFGG